MKQQTVAQAIVDQIAAWQVEYVFGVCGGDILPFLDAMGRAGAPIRYIGASSEAGAAFMASYYARLSGGLGVCIASAAGAINLLQGILDAHMDGVSVLAITGQVAGSKIGTPAKQYFPQGSLFRTFTAYSATVAEAAVAPRLLIRAMSRALLKKTTAHLAFPEDIWSKTTVWKPAPRPALVQGQGRQQGVHLSGDLGKTVRLMSKSKCPLIILGAKGKPATAETKVLADKWGAAIVLAQEAKGMIPDSWHRIIGGVGEGRLPGLLGDVDCILMVGSASFENQFLSGAPVIQLEEETWEINDLHLWNSLSGSPAHILKTLTEGLGNYQGNPSWQGKIAAAKKDWQEMVYGDANNNSTPVHPARLMATLAGTASGDAVVTLDIGAFMHWFDRSFQAKEQTILLSSMWRSMGAGLPAAIAAQLKFPNRQVIALVGDGGLLMTLGEFAIAVRHKLPITVIVIRNQAYSLEQNKGEAGNLRSVGLEVPAVEFSMYAQACGGKGFKVENPADLEATLSQALGLGEPVLIDVVCSAARLPHI